MADAKMEIGFEEEIELLRMNAPIPARGAGLLVGDFDVDIRDLRRAAANWVSSNVGESCAD
jgi:hypothetical protein